MITNRLLRLKDTHPVLEKLAAAVEQGNFSEETLADMMYQVHQDPILLQFTHKRLTIRRLWNLRKLKYEAGPYAGKKVFATRDSSKHIVDVLEAKGYKFKYPNNLDFVFNFFKHNKVSNFKEFEAIIKTRSPEIFPHYAQLQLDAMSEYGHLGED